MKYVIISIHLLFVYVLQAQSPHFVKAFNNIKDTNFVLYATRWNVNSISPEVKSLKDFYVVDYKTIKYITNTWFAKPDDEAFFMCGYDYSVDLKHNDTVIWSGSINLDCKSSLFDHQSYQLPSNAYSVLASHALYMKIYDSTYVNIEDARWAYSNLKKNKNIFINDMYWFKYDGYTVFEYVVEDTAALKKENYYFNELSKKVTKLQNTNKNMYVYFYPDVNTGSVLRYKLYCYFKESDKLDAIEDFNKVADWKRFDTFELTYYLKMKRRPAAY